MKNTIFMTDCETAGSLDQPLVYDIGAMVLNGKGEPIDCKPINHINHRVFYDRKDLMESAYYAEKLPAYRDEIWSGEREVFDILETRERVHKLCKEMDINIVCAHNARFDINALNNTVREASNGRIHYFFPYGIEVWDTLKMARQLLKDSPSYHKFCEENGYMTAHSKPRPRLTAEVIYRYITKDTDFEEAHTGLRDVEIEAQILAYFLRKHKKVDKVLYHAPNKA